MDVLSGATGTTIDRSHFSNVGRDQNNYYQTIVQNGEKETKTSRSLPGLSEYTEVKRGDIYKHGNVCYSWRLCSNGKDDTEAAVYHAEVNIVGSFGQKKYTVKTYHGSNGKKEWQRDFRRCSRDWQGDIPLFGYNKSSVPSLIFHGELVPIAHVEKQVGIMGRMYFDILSNVLRCSKNEIWMDPTKQSFSHGPIGPKCLEPFHQFNNIEIPLDVEFLKEDVIIRYLSSKKYDQSLLSALSFSSPLELLKEAPSVCYHHVISSTTNSMIAINQNVRWRRGSKGCLHFNGMTADGLTRFLLPDHGRCIEVWSYNEIVPWLLQASSVFNAHNIQFDEDLSNFKLLFPFFKLKGTLQSSKSKLKRRQLWWPIFLFVLPSPSPDTCYFWSHNPSGKNPFLPDMCEYLGLPVTLSITTKYFQKWMPTKVYKTIYNYQVARGFDPTTTDFAQSLGYSLFEVMSLEDRFHELDSRASTSGSDQTDENGRQVHSISTKPVQETTTGSFLNTLSSWFALNAVESAGISALAC